MKNQVIKIEKKEEAKPVEKKVRVRKEATPLQNLLNEKMKQLRKNIFQVVKNFKDNELTDETKNKIETAFNNVNDVLVLMKNEVTLEKRFATLTDAEKEFLKKMLVD